MTKVAPFIVLNTWHISHYNYIIRVQPQQCNKVYINPIQIWQKASNTTKNFLKLQEKLKFLWINKTYKITENYLRQPQPLYFLITWNPSQRTNGGLSFLQQTLDTREDSLNGSITSVGLALRRTVLCGWSCDGDLGVSK